MNPFCANSISYLNIMVLLRLRDFCYYFKRIYYDHKLHFVFLWKHYLEMGFLSLSELNWFKLQIIFHDLCMLHKTRSINLTGYLSQNHLLDALKHVDVNLSLGCEIWRKTMDHLGAWPGLDDPLYLESKWCIYKFLPYFSSSKWKLYFRVSDILQLKFSQ